MRKILRLLAVIPFSPFIIVTGLSILFVGGALSLLEFAKTGKFPSPWSHLGNID